MNKIRKILNKLLATRGLTTTQAYSTFEYQRNELIHLLKITEAIDVGANIGQWVQGMRDGGFTGHITSIEPDPRAVTKLKELDLGSHTIIPAAASDKNGLEILHLWDLEGGSTSLYNLTDFGENFTFTKNDQLKNEEVSTVRLDKILSNTPPNTLLKIDVQGYEMPVLLGTTGILNNISLLEIEIPLIPVYKNSATFTELTNWLLTNNYRLCSVQTERWSGFGAADTDALFMKQDIYDRLTKDRMTKK